MNEEQPTHEEKLRRFAEREIIPLSNGGEVEVLVKDEREEGELVGKFSFSINVRSASETEEIQTQGDVYYDKLQTNGGTLPITGDGSIEGLLAAGRYLKDLLPRLPQLGASELWIEGDQKRIDAYRKFVLRLGFEETLGVFSTPAFVYHSKNA